MVCSHASFHYNREECDCANSVWNVTLWRWVTNYLFFVRNLHSGNYLKEEPDCSIRIFVFRECVRTGAAGARTRRSLGHHLLHPLILRLLVLCAPADCKNPENRLHRHPQIQTPNTFPASSGVSSSSNCGVSRYWCTKYWWRQIGCYVQNAVLTLHF